MFNKIKEWAKTHLVYEMIPLYIVGTAIVISFIVTLLVYYKAPISLDNSKDKAMIEKMINDQNPNSKIENLELKSGVIYVGLKDSIYKLSDKIEDDNDILWYTRVLKYTAISDSDTVKCTTIFEMDEKFLKERVGKHLITIRDIQ